jgi:RNA polymerase sigma-70 factor, ECF subfamily
VVSVLTQHDVLTGNGADWDWRAVSRLCLQVATRILGPGSTAEDAAQEAAIVAWRHRTDCRSPEAPWPWIAVIARREALRQRAGASPVQLEDDAVAAPPEEHQTLLRLDVRRALAELSEHDRALVLARYWNDLTQEQVAAVLQIPSDTVKVRLHRLRERLRPILLEP